MDATCMGQLVLVKYLFQQGEGALDVHNDMACGVAVSHFQDAVEMFLYAAVKEKGLNIKDRCGFLDLWQTVDGDAQHRLPFRAEMMELNKVRVNFKHYGIHPAPSVAERCLVNTRRFLADAAQAIFGEDFESVSLVNLIQDERIRIILKQAEQHLARGELSECMGQCAKAHELASRLPARIIPSMSQSMSVIAERGDCSGKMFIDLGNYLNVLREISLAAILHVPANDFFRYAALDPNARLVIHDVFGEPHIHEEKTREHDEDDVRFVLRYVTDYVRAVEARVGVGVIVP